LTDGKLFSRIKRDSCGPHGVLVKLYYFKTEELTSLDLNPGEFKVLFYFEKDTCPYEE